MEDLSAVREEPELFQLFLDQVSPFTFLDLVFVTQPGGSHPGLLFLSLIRFLTMLPVVWQIRFGAQSAQLGLPLVGTLPAAFGTWSLIQPPMGPVLGRGGGRGVALCHPGELPTCLAAWKSACLAS